MSKKNKKSKKNDVLNKDFIKGMRMADEDPVFTLKTSKKSKFEKSLMDTPKNISIGMSKYICDMIKECLSKTPNISTNDIYSLMSIFSIMIKHLPDSELNNYVEVYNYLDSYFS